jgi:hypothetical protein
MEYIDHSGGIRKVKNRAEILKNFRETSFAPEKTMKQFQIQFAKRFYEVYGKKINTTSEEAFLKDLIYYGEVRLLKPTPKKTIAGVKKKTTVKKKIGKVETYYDRFL